MDISRMIDKNNCKTNLKGKSKEAIITSLVQLASAGEAMKEISLQEVVTRLMKRESQGSTGIGAQIAIPHAEIPGLKQFVVCLATSKKGLEFDAIDKKKVRLFFLILGPEGKAAEHLQILATISRAIAHPNVKSELLMAPTEISLYESFIRHIHAVHHASGERESCKLLTLILFDESLIYPILEIFIQEGIDGANITDSSGMGEFISNVPLFAGFLGFMNENTNKSRTVQTLIPESRLDELLVEIENVTGDLDKQQGAAWFVTPVERWKGSLRMM